MNLDQLAQLGEFVGGMFVVVSLVYIAHQVRQNTRSHRTENYARVLERMSTLQSRLAVDRELHRIFMTGAQDPAELSPGERLRFAWAAYEMFGAAEFIFHQSRDRALPADVWRRWEASIRWWLSYPGMQAWWKAKPAPFTADFQAFADGIISSGRGNPEAEGRWLAFVSGDRLERTGFGLEVLPA